MTVLRNTLPAFLRTNQRWIALSLVIVVQAMFFKCYLTRSFVGSQIERKSDPYRTLGLAVNSSVKEVIGAYYRLAEKHHPDINEDDPSAGQKFREIVEAYLTLGGKPERSSQDIIDELKRNFISTYDYLDFLSEEYAKVVGKISSNESKKSEYVVSFAKLREIYSRKSAERRNPGNQDSSFSFEEFLYYFIMIWSAGFVVFLWLVVPFLFHLLYKAVRQYDN